MSLCRTAKLAKDIGEHGLTLATIAGGRCGWSRRGRFSLRPRGARRSRIICVAVKSADTADAAARSPSTRTRARSVVSFQNGISNIDVLERGASRPVRDRSGERRLQCRLSRRRALSQGRRGSSLERTAGCDAGDLRAGRHGPRGAKAVRRHARPRLGQAPHQHEQCSERAVRPHPPRRASQARLPSRIRCLGPGGPWFASPRGHRARRASSPLPIRLLPAILETPDWLFNNLFFRSGRSIPRRARR